MKKIIIGISLASLIGFSSCGSLGGGGGSILGSVLGSSKESMASRAIREVLLNGILKGISSFSDSNSDHLYKLLLPKEVANVVTTLEQLGMGSLVNNVVSEVNEGAKMAITTAKPIFTEAVQNMSIVDAIQLVNGGPNSITTFFQQRTADQLLQAFQPIVAEKLTDTDALQTYGRIAQTINALPISQHKISTDLTQFVAQQAMNGMFSLIAQEEVNIRENVAARTSEVLKAVFANPGNF